MVQSIKATSDQLDTFGITLTQAKNLPSGTILNCLDMTGTHVITNADETPARLKVTSVKTWKRMPDRIELKVQRGLYEHYTFGANDLPRIKVA